MNGNQRVEGAEAVSFFRKSGLPNEKLKAIWLTAARTSNEYLNRDEFYIALRLIAYAQNGMTADENAIELNLDVDLPRLDGGNQQKPPSSPAPPQVDLAKDLPDLDSLDLNEMNGGGAAQPPGAP